MKVWTILNYKIFELTTYNNPGQIQSFGMCSLQVPTLWCSSQSGNHPQEDLTKQTNESFLNNKLSILHYYLLLHSEFFQKNPPELELLWFWKISKKKKKKKEPKSLIFKVFKISELEVINQKKIQRTTPEYWLIHTTVDVCLMLHFLHSLLPLVIRQHFLIKNP